MSNITALLERVRARTKTRSVYAVAQVLRTHPANVAKMYAGRRYPGTEACFRIAQYLGMDARDVIALVEQEKAESPEARAFWRDRAPRLSPPHRRERP